MLKRERLNESDRRVPADYNVYEPDIYEKTAVFAVEAIFCLIVGYLFYGTWITVLAAPAVFMPALKLYSENMIRKRRRELLISFRDFISRISSSFAGGRQMTESIEEAASDIFQGADKKNIMALEAGNMLNLIRSGNMTDLEALTDFARRADMED
ncbi:MAG: hypothetical protein PUB39_04035, partial [Eubacteriales bacterium]|nr:hypothetical protein [Eubacteriales bacterium]